MFLIPALVAAYRFLISKGDVIGPSASIIAGVCMYIMIPLLRLHQVFLAGLVGLYIKGDITAPEAAVVGSVIIAYCIGDCCKSLRECVKEIMTTALTELRDWWDKRR